MLGLPKIEAELLTDNRFNPFAQKGNVKGETRQWDDQYYKFQKR